VSDHPDSAKLKALEEKIEAMKGAEAPTSKTEEHHSQAQLAWRMVIELVAGLGIGFGIGYGLDSLLGTMPIFLIIFILLGFIAGVRTMLRSAEEAQEKLTAPEVHETKIADASAHEKED